MQKLKRLFKNKTCCIQRDAHGVPNVQANTLTDLYWGLGYCHALDRGMQMLLMRILGRGQACEHLEDSEEMLAIDKFFRRMNWMGQVEPEISKLDPETNQLCQAYCDGANTVFGKKVPWEFKLLGYKPDPWQIRDIILLTRMTGYLTLAQSQGEIERLFVEMVQAGVDLKKLEALFPGILEGLDIELLEQVNLAERIVPEAVRWNAALPKMMASNNWVISGARTASGKPILANDPHLETNRLPNVWYEIVLQTQDRYATGATMPGLPGVLIGRTTDLAWGATYTFMDAIDSWVEKCKKGWYFQGGEEWAPFRQRREAIQRKKNPPVEIVFYENQHGVLEGDPNREGYYLATRWASAQAGAQSLMSVAKMWHAGTVEEGMSLLGTIETAFNWVLADRDGNIGYQMSGLMPKRRAGVSGFVPLPGWEKENDWQGFVDHTDLPRCLNPDSGYFVTANEDLNAYGRAKPINIYMAPYRSDRIKQLLAENASSTIALSQKIHYDVYSLQAEQFMRILRPLLPETSQGRILEEWDCRYAPDSKGAFLFEQIYCVLLQKVFGENGFGLDALNFMADETGIFVAFYHNFDRVLFSEQSEWFGEKSREQIFREAIEQALTVAPQPWRNGQNITLAHLLFGGKLPKLFGFDRGPICIPGGRATPHQGQIYRSAGRATSFTPSFRMVTDMASDAIHTNLAGGPSDRRFSAWYCSDLDNWLNGRYKTLAPKNEGI